ncbi:unnamed protein product [Sphagnum balticum]
MRPGHVNIGPTMAVCNQVCDDDDMFDMVNIGSPSQDIKSGANTTLDMAMLGDLVNEAFKEWILLKVDKSAWLLNELTLDDIDKIDNLITLFKLATNATEAATNIIKYFDLDDDVKDDKTNEGMEIVVMLKLATHDIQQQHNANRSAITWKRVRNE